MFKLTANNVKRLFVEEMGNYNFPCHVEIKDEIPDDDNSCSGFAFGDYKSKGKTTTKPSYRKNVPDELVEVTFYPESFIYDCWISLDMSLDIPKVAKNTIMWLATTFGIGISEEKMRDAVRSTIAHEYRHTMQFSYMIKHGLDMASYHKDEKWCLYGYGLLEKDAIEYSKGNVRPIEDVFAEKRYYKRDWTWLEAAFV